MAAVLQLLIQGKQFCLVADKHSRLLRRGQRKPGLRSGNLPLVFVAQCQRYCQLRNDCMIVGEFKTTDAG